MRTQTNKKFRLLMLSMPRHSGILSSAEGRSAQNRARSTRRDHLNTHGKRLQQSRTRACPYTGSSNGLSGWFC